jgi:hypothetical protein
MGKFVKNQPAMPWRNWRAPRKKWRKSIAPIFFRYMLTFPKDYG